MPMKAIIKNLHLSGEYMTLTIDGDEKKFKITPMPGAGTTKDENGVVAIKGESR
jgi:hypothetical protein